MRQRVSNDEARRYATSLGGVGGDCARDLIDSRTQCSDLRSRLQDLRSAVREALTASRHLDDTSKNDQIERTATMLQAALNSEERCVLRDAAESSVVS